MKRLLANTHGPGKGFSFLEIILAIVVVGILIAVIVPRAQRANVDAKYAGVRQAAAEIGRWGMDWATRNLESQLPDASCNLDDYLETLVGYVGDPDDTNWINVNDELDDGLLECRWGTEPINYSVSDIIPIESRPRNPFNGLSYFNTEGGNSDDEIQPGLLYLAVLAHTDGANHYYFVYTGTDSTAADRWHAGMGEGLTPEYAELRNGIFMARQVP